MALFLQRIDSVPMTEMLPPDFNQWTTVLVDTLNESLRTIQNSLNLPLMPQLTSVQIASLDATLANGVIMYDKDLDVYVGKEAGTLVKFTTTPYP